MEHRVILAYALLQCINAGPHIWQYADSLRSFGMDSRRALDWRFRPASHRVCAGASTAARGRSFRIERGLTLACFRREPLRSPLR